MIVGVDTDVLVAWVMRGAPFHEAVRQFMRQELQRQDWLLGLVPQVLFEFIHVCTDARRFEHPLSMEQALQVAKQLWNSREVAPVQQEAGVLQRTLDLMAQHGLGRKRILDTALAVTLAEAGVKKLLTLNGRDYAIFPFLKTIIPT